MASRAQRLAQAGAQYETVAASQTAQALGATGAAGDILRGVLIVPASTSPGAVQIKDGSGTAITDLGDIRSADGAWQVTTGANVSAVAVGSFS